MTKAVRLVKNVRHLIRWLHPRKEENLPCFVSQEHWNKMNVSYKKANWILLNSGFRSHSWRKSMELACKIRVYLYTRAHADAHTHAHSHAHSEMEPTTETTKDESIWLHDVRTKPKRHPRCSGSRGSSLPRLSAVGQSVGNYFSSNVKLKRIRKTIPRRQSERMISMINCPRFGIIRKPPCEERWLQRRPRHCCATYSTAKSLQQFPAAAAAADVFNRTVNDTSVLCHPLSFVSLRRPKQWVAFVE